MVVDSDTKDVPGTPPISDTILKKIDACDVFLADMTFVAATEEGKLSPNPNVMGEYGYALKAKGWPNILLVMNAAFGVPEDLPFDLHHLRHPLSYSVGTVKPETARRAARDRLAEALELALETIADKRPPPPPPPGLRAPLEARRWETLNARISNNPPTLVFQPQAVLHVIPAAALEEPAIDHRLAQRHRHLLRPASDAEAVEGQDHTQWWTHGPRRQVGDLPNPEAWWCGRLLRPGIVEHVFALAERIGDDPEILVRGFTLEKQIVTLADRSLELLARLGLVGPTLVGVVLYGLEDVRLMGGPRVGRFSTPTLSPAPALVPAGELKAGDHLNEAFNQLWLGAGVADGSLSFASGDRWGGYLPGNAY